MLGKESINPSLGSAELFHDEQVMELIPTLSPMDSEPSNVILLSDGLQVVEARDIREVWYSCHSLQDVESGIWLVLVKSVNDIDKRIDELGKKSSGCLINWKSVGNHVVQVIKDLIVAVTFTV